MKPPDQDSGAGPELPRISWIGGVWGSVRIALNEDRRLLSAAAAFALASFVVYRLVVLFGLAR